MDMNLANIGKDTATYSISVVQIRMKENGGFETITEPDPGQLFADKYIRFFPRSVTLGPSESQVVKVQITKVNELNQGNTDLISISGLSQTNAFGCGKGPIGRHNINISEA